MNDLIPKLKSNIRNLKLSIVLENNFEFQADLKKLRKGKNIFFNQKYWSILKEWKDKSIITGTAALYAFDLCERLPQDIDLIVDKNNFNPGRKLSNDRYPGMDGKMDVIGYYADRKRGYNVDFFHNTKANFIEIDGWKFHHPFEIMEKKLEIYKHRERNNSKDIHDLIYIFRKLKSDFNFSDIDI